MANIPLRPPRLNAISTSTSKRPTAPFAAHCKAIASMPGSPVFATSATVGGRRRVEPSTALLTALRRKQRLSRRCASREESGAPDANGRGFWSRCASGQPGAQRSCRRSAGARGSACPRQRFGLRRTVHGLVEHPQHAGRACAAHVEDAGVLTPPVCGPGWALALPATLSW
jgi:hypothetical protein